MGRYIFKSVRLNLDPKIAHELLRDPHLVLKQ